MKTVSPPFQDPAAAAVLERLHAEADGDKWVLARNLPAALFGMARGKALFDAITPSMLREAFIPVDPEQGALLYLTARAIGARTIVEFGTSFGISTIYLAAAIRDNGGGTVIGTEIEPGKHGAAIDYISEAGLAEFAEIRLGDALTTLQDLPGPVDLVFLDGWKNLYIPVMKLLMPKLRPGAVVLADNIFTFKRSLRPFVEFMENPANGFHASTLALGEGLEYAVYRGAAAT